MYHPGYGYGHDRRHVTVAACTGRLLADISDDHCRSSSDREVNCSTGEERISPGRSEIQIRLAGGQRSSRRKAPCHATGHCSAEGVLGRRGNRGGVLSIHKKSRCRRREGRNRVGDIHGDGAGLVSSRDRLLECKRSDRCDRERIHRLREGCGHQRAGDNRRSAGAAGAGRHIDSAVAGACRAHRGIGDCSARTAGGTRENGTWNNWSDWSNWGSASATTTATSGYKSSQQQCQKPHQWFTKISEFVHVYLLITRSRKASVYS